MQVHCLLTGTPWLRTGWWWWVRCTDTRGSATSPTSSSYQVSSLKTSLSFLIKRLYQGLDPGDRQVLEQKYSGSEPPCLLDTSDGRWVCSLKQSQESWTWHICWDANPLPRFVLKGPCYNPLDVMNCLMTRRGYKVSWGSIPNEYEHPSLISQATEQQLSI